MQQDVSTAAFVLRARPYGESDRIVTFITERHGKLTGIAKGARNSRRRFAGTLEPFVHVRAVFRQRPATDLVFLVRCELLASLRAFTRDLDRFAAGSYLLELTDRMVHGREPGHEVYGLVHDALGRLDGGAPCDPVIRAFELQLLAATGWAPALDRCRGCGAAADGAVPVYLAAERGVLVCRACVEPGEPLRPLSPATARALARLAGTPLAREVVDLPPAALADAGAIAERLLARVATGPLRARDFMTRTRVDSPPGVR